MKFAEAKWIAGENVSFGRIKSGNNNLFFPFALIAVLGLTLAGHTMAQGVTNLHSFSDGSDGINPYAGLILSGNTLYGMTYRGGSSDNGGVFAVKTNGTGFANLYNFTATPSVVSKN